MKLLLDTHIWLWSLLEPDRLSRRVRKELTNPASELWLSSISVWEFLTLHGRGRVVLQGSAEDWLREAAEALPAKEATITHEVAIETSRFSLPHRDSADRFLVATANVFGLTLVTADNMVIKAKRCPVLANR